jgi:hypothetical protein
MRHYFLAIAVLAACGGGDPADVAGDYSISLTNRENGCEFDNWQEGNTATNVPVVITQGGEGEEDQATAVVNGVAGTYLDLVLGSRTYTGEVSGSHLELTLFGTTQGTQGNCSYNVNSIIDADLDGDVIEGDLLYHTQTNGSPECGVLEGCESRQEFNGTRPPT